MFDHDRPETVEEYEYSEKFYHSETAELYAVYVSTVGGGTEGHAYSNNFWHIRIVHVESQETVMEASDLYVGYPCYHHMAAEIAMEFFEG